MTNESYTIHVGNEPSKETQSCDLKHGNETQSLLVSTQVSSISLKALFWQFIDLPLLHFFLITGLFITPIGTPVLLCLTLFRLLYGILWK